MLEEPVFSGDSAALVSVFHDSQNVNFTIHESWYPGSMLKGQDLLIAFHLAGTPKKTLAEMGLALGMSVGEVHKAVGRLQMSQLLLHGSRTVHLPHLIEFAVHGARFAFPPVYGGKARGIPTAQSVAPLNEHLVAPAPEEALVWKHPEGTLRAQTLDPIYPSALQAALADPELYRKLAILDGIRVGSARVREISKDLMVKELNRAS